MQRSFGFPPGTQSLFLFEKDANLKASSSYSSAKAGSEQAAVALLIDLAKALVPQKRFVHLLKERFDDEFTEIFGTQPTALTANEANYLVGFASINGLRNRLAAAQQEIDRRLRSKGISRATQGPAYGASFATRLKPD